MSDFKPTDEQLAALDAYATGDNLIIEAAAGAGKTATLKLLAEAYPDRSVQYLAFNRAIVLEAQERMPSNVKAQTIHSLAFRAVGWQYKHRLDSWRMRSEDIARRLGIEKMGVTVDGGLKVLGAGYLAGLVMRGITIFCQSADDEPSGWHIPYVQGIDMPVDGRRTFENNRLLRSHLEPFMAAAWEDLQSPNGQLPFRHEHYLKIFQLSRPRIPVDAILFDECQPPETEVLRFTGKNRNKSRVFERIQLADVKLGDRIVGYGYGKTSTVIPRGYTVRGITRKPHHGWMIRVATDTGETSRYTPNHICLARIGPALKNKTILYLMRRGNQYRIGITKAHHGNGRRESGLNGRMRQEGGDAAWILQVFDTRADALVEENWVSITFGLPQMVWAHNRPWQDRERLDQFWERIGGNEHKAAEALAYFGRDLRYPFAFGGAPKLYYHRHAMIRACNLLDGMLVGTVSGMINEDHFDRAINPQLRLTPDDWRPISVKYEHYTGDVISLDLDGQKCYIADGIVTHNCQDVSPVMDSIVAQQVDVQRVLTGDSSQSIYGFSGAEDSIAKMIAADPNVTRTTLSQSWRFGQSVADVANRVLELLPTDMVVRGNPGLASTVGDVADPHVILTRTNAAAVNALLRGQREGRRAHLVGGGDQVLHFAQGAQALQTGGNTSHPDLACFDNWGAVQEYVKLDMQGDELRLLVSLVDDFGAATIIHALGSMPDERNADLVISTAHKAKGRQWETVQLAGDFPAEIESMSDEELRLLYVAVTRAQMRLDAEAVPWVVGGMQAPPAPVQAAQEPASGPHPLWRRQTEMATGC